MTSYKSLRCYRCGNHVIEQCALTDTWDMRLDGKLHAVPVRNVPCQRCINCGNVTLGGDSDEIIMYCTRQYMTANGMNTPYRRACRWLRRRVAAWQTRVWLLQQKFRRLLRAHAV